MEAPIKIFRTTTYLNSNRGNTVWKDAPVSGAENVEYIRKDAFIEKALKFLDGCIPDYIELKHANVDTFMDVNNKRFIKDFINHMKGELHCHQEQCKKKDQCYRYWLGQEIKNTDFQYASFFHPEEPVTDGCTYYINKEYFD